MTNKQLKIYCAIMILLITGMVAISIYVTFRDPTNGRLPVGVSVTIKASGSSGQVLHYRAGCVFIRLADNSVVGFENFELEKR